MTLFKYAAKSIHIIYGQTRYEAARLIGLNARAIHMAININTTSTIIAAPIICAPKNRYVHNAFNIICAKNSKYALVLCARVRSLFIIRNSAIPSNPYRIVHAAPKTQPDGVKTDLFNALYHMSDAPDGVNVTPINPGINAKTIATIK